MVLSSSRPGGVNYVSGTARDLDYEVKSGRGGRIVIYDADLQPQRAWPADAEVIRPTRPHMLNSLNLDWARDKHHDQPDRIKWRAKMSLDYLFALEFALAQPERYVLVLEDDVLLASDLVSRLDAIVRLVTASNDSNWLAWTLFHNPEFDTRRGYAHGDPFEFQAGMLALLYQKSHLPGLIAFFRQHWQHDPTDFILRNYQAETHQTIRVAIPSLAQHLGITSSFAGKQGMGRVATDFVGRDVRVL